MAELNPILGPAAILAVWSVLILLIYVVRVLGSGAKLGDLPVGYRGPDNEADVPEKMKWTRHNYEHLLEQPTAFYAVVVILALVGDVSTTSLYAAWTYTIARVLHSLWQMQVNTVPVRFVLFAVSTAALLVLGVNAVMATV